MADLPTRADLFDIGADEVLSRSAARPAGQRLTAGEVYTEGSDINIAVAASSVMAEEVVRQVALRTAAWMLDNAEGEDLDRLVADRYSPTIVRKGATPALVTLEFSRVAGALPGAVIAQGTKVRTTDGIEFETTAVATFLAGSTGPVSAPAQAVLTGQDGNVAETTITEFLTQPSDPNITVTNPDVAAGGDEEETDPRLRDRARKFYLAARRGTVPAIEFGALTVAGVRQATAIEQLDDLGRPNGFVSLYIADALGQANSALVAAVEVALLEWRGAGVYVYVSAAVPSYVDIVLRLRFESGYDSTAAFEQVRLAVVAAVNRLAPGKTLTEALITKAIQTVPGVIVLDDAVQAPVGDVVPVASQVLRTTVDRVEAE